MPRTSASPLSCVLAAVAFLLLALPAIEQAEAKGKRTGCPQGMASVLGKFCIDKYEASTREILPRGKSRSHSPYKPVEGLKIRAVSRRNVKPQGHISRNQAEAACKSAGKRLCRDDEWIMACKGKRPTLYPYGNDRKDRWCNDHGVSSFNLYYGSGGAEPPKEAYTFENLNDPRLNQVKGGLAPTGAFKKCRNSFGVYDMVGNLHEWTASSSGTFRGGYYLDTQINGAGCDYHTTAHSPRYYDYSTGFRCCK